MAPALPSAAMGAQAAASRKRGRSPSMLATIISDPELEEYPQKRHLSECMASDLHRHMSLASYSSDDFISSEGINSLNTARHTTPPPLASNPRPGPSFSGLGKSAHTQGMRGTSGTGATGSGNSGPLPTAGAVAVSLSAEHSCVLQQDTDAADGGDGAMQPSAMQASMSDCSQLNSATSVNEDTHAGTAGGALGRSLSAGGGLVAHTWPPSKVTSSPPSLSASQLVLQQQQQQVVSNVPLDTAGVAEPPPPLVPRRSVPGLPPLWAPASPSPASQQQQGAAGAELGGGAMDLAGAGAVGLLLPPQAPLVRPLASRRMSESLFRSLSAGLVVPPSSAALLGHAGGVSPGPVSPSPMAGASKPRPASQRTPTNSQPQMQELMPPSPSDARFTFADLRKTALLRSLQRAGPAAMQGVSLPQGGMAEGAAPVGPDPTCHDAPMMLVDGSAPPAGGNSACSARFSTSQLPVRMAPTELPVVPVDSAMDDLVGLPRVRLGATAAGPLAMGLGVTCAAPGDSKLAPSPPPCSVNPGAISSAMPDGMAGTGTARLVPPISPPKAARQPNMLGSPQVTPFTLSHHGFHPHTHAYHHSHHTLAGSSSQLGGTRPRGSSPMARSESWMDTMNSDVGSDGSSSSSSGAEQEVEQRLRRNMPVVLSSAGIAPLPPGGGQFVPLAAQGLGAQGQVGLGPEGVTLSSALQGGPAAAGIAHGLHTHLLVGMSSTDGMDVHGAGVGVLGTPVPQSFTSSVMARMSTSGVASDVLKLELIPISEGS